LNLAISVAVISLVFAFLFKYLPDVKIEWRDVMLGAVVTALLFTIGKFLIGMYLGKASFSSSYGAAGSLVIVLVWVYYSAQIFFFGAEFTQVYACEHGSDPLCTRRERESAAQASKAIPAPPSSRKGAEPAHEYAREASGNKMMNWFGVVVGSLLAGTRAAKTFKK
jgi:membrane protein